MIVERENPIRKYNMEEISFNSDWNDRGRIEVPRPENFYGNAPIGSHQHSLAEILKEKGFVDLVIGNHATMSTGEPLKGYIEIYMSVKTREIFTAIVHTPELRAIANAEDSYHDLDFGDIKVDEFRNKKLQKRLKALKIDNSKRFNKSAGILEEFEKQMAELLNGDQLPTRDEIKDLISLVVDFNFPEYSEDPEAARRKRTQILKAKDIADLDPYGVRE